MADHQERPGAMPVAAVLAATGVAVLGTLGWMFVHYERSGLNWGTSLWILGIGMGIATTAMGGRGIKMALLAALLYSLSIAGGSYGTAWLRFDRFAETRRVSQNEYERVNRDAVRWAKVDPEDERAVAAYMVDRRFIGHLEPRLVTTEDVTAFLEEDVQALDEWHANPPSFDEWAEGVRQAEREVNLLVRYGDQDASVTDIMRADWEELGFPGRFFFGLGLVTLVLIVTRGLTEP